MQGNSLAVGGTEGNDAFTITPSAVVGSLIARLGSVTLGTFSPPSGEVVLFGGFGTNTLALEGTSGVDAFSFSGNVVAVNGFVVATSAIDAAALNGLGGNDSFSYLDTPGLAVTINGGTAPTACLAPTPCRARTGRHRQ